VLEEVAGQKIRELLAATMPVLAEFDSKTNMRILCQYVLDHRELWRTLLTGGAAHSVRAEFVRQACERTANSPHRINPRVPVELGTVCASGALLDALGWWLADDHGYAVEDMAQYIGALIIEPLLGTNG